MTLLILGLVLFFTPHLVAPATGARAALVSSLGETAYKAIYSLLSLAGLALIVIGFQSQDDALLAQLYEPLDQKAARGFAHAAMPIAFILVAGANMKSNLKRYIGHPMALGVLVWAAVHLAANGQVADVMLFGAFGLYALLDMLVLAKPAETPPVQPRKKDLILVVAGTITFAVTMFIHGFLGYPVVG